MFLCKIHLKIRRVKLKPLNTLQHLTTSWWLPTVGSVGNNLCRGMTQDSSRLWHKSSFLWWRDYMMSTEKHLNCACWMGVTPDSIFFVCAYSFSLLYTIPPFPPKKNKTPKKKRKGHRLQGRTAGISPRKLVSLIPICRMWIHSGNAELVAELLFLHSTTLLMREEHSHLVILPAALSWCVPQEKMTSF